MSMTKLANPAVVGLGGFGLTTLLLQVHNLGYLGIGPVLAMGFIYGGLAQFIAGFKEQQMGNNFGFCAFAGYGSFWIGLGIIWLCNHFGVYKTTETEMGWFLLMWGLFTGILLIGSFWIHKAMIITFATLFIGFMLLTIGHWGYPIMNKVAAIDLIVCALAAWYMMAAIIFNDLSGKTVLPLGVKGEK